MKQQFGRVALFASASLVLAACTTTGDSAPVYPITQPSEAPPPPAYAPEPIPVEPPPSAAPSQAVTSQPLPPPAAYVPPPAPIPEAAPIPQPAPYRPPPPPVVIVTVTGKVVDAEGPPQVHTVKRGDTIDAIAREFGITRKQLVDANDIDDASKIKPGLKLTGPRSKAKAYVVGQGDTMYAISRRFNVTAAALADANDLKVGASIRSGQKLILPKGYKDGGAIRRTVAAPTPAPYVPPYTPPAPRPYVPPAPAPYTPPAPVPYTPPTPAPYVPPRAAAPAPAPVTPPTSYPRPTPVTPPATRPAIIDSTQPPSDADVIAAGRGRFNWPVKGETIGTFGPNGAGGQRSDGLNIRATAGEPVRAAAAGEVVYAGDQVPEFGNLVLVKHADGWVTAYAHLGRADVKMRQTVTQGQQIGVVGMSGGVAEPQLHFEVRYAPSPKDKARPINPSLVLPR